MSPKNGPEPTAQFKAIDLADAFHDHDQAALEQMTPAERAGQERIREGLYRYADRLWDDVKASTRDRAGAGWNAADDPAYSGVAGMRDLTAELLAAVRDARSRAGDDLDQ
jgi:hypothetical protein